MRVCGGTRCLQCEARAQVMVSSLYNVSSTVGPHNEWRGLIIVMPLKVGSRGLLKIEMADVDVSKTLAMEKALAK